MTRAFVGLLSLAAGMSAQVVAQAASTAFLKFESNAALARFLVAHPGIERLHPALLWAFGARDVLAAAAARESDEVVAGSFSENRAFRLPRDRKAAVKWPVHEAIGVDSRLWGITRMRAPKVWEVTRGEGVLVAVVDTGVDASHPALAPNAFVNESEKNGRKGIDDDANGYIDDVDGWDFYSNRADPDDDEGHGSHVAGTIAGNLASSHFFGVAPGARILAVKTHNAKGESREDAVVKGILYAADRGAKVINCSWGGEPEAPDYSLVLFDAIKYAGTKGSLLVAAAGNDGSNNDRTPSYPSNYEVENVMAVASTTSRDGLSSFSNYGAQTVHVAAPGSSVYSARAGGGYVTHSGTSMASPHAAGAAALVYAKLGTSATPEQVRDVLMQNAEALSSLGGRVKAGFLSLDFLSESVK